MPCSVHGQVIDSIPVAIVRSSNQIGASGRPGAAQSSTVLANGIGAKQERFLTLAVSVRWGSSILPCSGQQGAWVFPVHSSAFRVLELLVPGFHDGIF